MSLLKEIHRGFSTDYYPLLVLRCSKSFDNDVENFITEWCLENQKPKDDISLVYKEFKRVSYSLGNSEFVTIDVDSIPLDEVSHFLLEHSDVDLSLGDEDAVRSILRATADKFYQRYLRKLVTLKLSDELLERLYINGTLNKYYPGLKDDYMMLSRLQRDCDYYLGYGSRDAKHCLWAEDEKKQILKMKEMWLSFPEERKPRWLTWEEILEYEKKMLQDKNG